MGCLNNIFFVMVVLITFMDLSFACTRCKNTCKVEGANCNIQRSRINWELIQECKFEFQRDPKSGNINSLHIDIAPKPGGSLFPAMGNGTVTNGTQNLAGTSH